jgi:Ca2+-binding EF-hand superfamily protein
METGNRQQTTMAAFELLDADKNGIVNNSEWRREVNQAASQLPQGEATDRYRRDLQALFNQLDVNHDAQIDRSEWDNGKFEIHSQ